FVRNGPSAAWVCQDVVAPAQREFMFRAPQDGEYDFNMVLVEPTGRRTPADITREAPELIVVVDTQPPECDLQVVSGANGELLLQCQVRDANPDASKTKLESQTSFGNWQPLGPHADYPGCFRIPSPQALRGKLRYTVFDRAGNSATRTINAASLRILTSTDSAQMLASSQSQSQKVAGPPPAPAPSPPAAVMPVAAQAPA